MIFLIIGVFGGAFFGFMSIKNISYGGMKFADYVMAVFIALISAIIGLMIGAALALFLGYFFDSNFHQTDRIPLVSMRDEQSISGRFFLGSGTIRNQRQYQFFKKLNDGGYRSSDVLAENAVVYEDAKLEGYLIVKSKSFDNKRVYLIGMVNKDIYEFHIPKESIKRGFAL